MSTSRTGTIITPPGAFINPHEKKAADFLAIEFGADIVFLVPNRQKGHKTPDIEMYGLLWEIKSPKGKGARTIENTLRDATKQSSYIILDLRRMDGRIPTKRHLHKIEAQFAANASIKRIIIITRDKNAIDLKR